MSPANQPILSKLAEGEDLIAAARAADAEIVVTSARIAIAAEDGRLAMDLPIESLRRIQFDIERTRPATLVIVPDEAGREPQVLAGDRVWRGWQPALGEERRQVVDALQIRGLGLGRQPGGTQVAPEAGRVDGQPAGLFNTKRRVRH